MAYSVSLKTKPTKNSNEHVIRLRITNRRKSAYWTTGIRLDKNHWDFNKEVVKTSYQNSQRLNNSLQKLKTNAQNICVELSGSNPRFFPKEAIDLLIQNNTDEVKFIEFALNQVELLTQKFGTQKRDKSILKKLLDYNKGKDILLEQITFNYLEKYEYYLRTVLGNGINTVHSNLKVIRKFVNIAEKKDLIDASKNPFYKYKLKQKNTERHFLSEDELKILEQLELTDGTREKQVLDMFIFSCYTGLRISDVLKLKWDNIKNGRINMVLHKTSEQSGFKMPDRAIEIAAKYEFTKETKTNNLFPFLKVKSYVSESEMIKSISSFNAYANKLLKVILPKAGIQKPLSFHCSRHTFATRAINKGMNIYKLSKVLGHQSVKTTQGYIKLIDTDLDDAMDLFND
jgi:integrase